LFHKDDLNNSWKKNEILLIRKLKVIDVESEEEKGYTRGMRLEEKEYQSREHDSISTMQQLATCCLGQFSSLGSLSSKTRKHASSGQNASTIGGEGGVVGGGEERRRWLT